ncbi:MAG TPA: right-handed parallel beta-helix repeat-containing protein [Bryobacteraceae bacterium]|nr:right-handed parallel beta-helix repeat-containing protein [Bryobacteraceae bacterium]
MDATRRTFIRTALAASTSFAVDGQPILPAASGRELHVSVHGNDSSDGSPSKPYKTVSAAARVAQPGDVITVHDGTYRERITPPRGGESDARRIVYQAAPGEKAIIKGSEVIRGWKPFASGVWKAMVPSSLFGSYNPYKDLIEGDWFTDKGRQHHTGEVYLNGKSLFEAHLLERVLHPQPFLETRDQDSSLFTWFCESDDKCTYIYANFHGKNPNDELVEINVRDSCFYPDQPGCDYITIRGFRMSHAATQWAAPTAEQIGLVGTHWSKGWIIEDNVISDSKCSGITLGKDRATGHNVWIKDPKTDGATHYNEVIVRALKAGWSREKIGSHIVRNNVIFNCEQTGICGSLGPIYSLIENNHIYNIWTKRQFTGAEMAGIKLHGAIDVVIRKNRLHNTGRGLWMDWMAQGTRITRNLCYDNSTDDLFVEVNHGPFLVDNNLFLSPISLYDMSEGGAYAHNLMTGKIVSRPELNRSTPYHEPHSTALAGICNTKGGDNRFYNNVFVGGAEVPAQTGNPNVQRVAGFGLWVYDTREFPLQMAGNVYYNGARPSAKEGTSAILSGIDPQIRLVEDGDGVYLHLALGEEAQKTDTTCVSTDLLGKAKIPRLGYENADGSPLIVDTDYAGKKRDIRTPSAGPFEQPSQGNLKLKVWSSGS